MTAFVLSNQIGIAGSIIGVAVGAAASALASQIYQNVIRRSTHKFRAATTMNITSRHIQTTAKQHLKAHNICLEHNMHLLASTTPMLLLPQNSRRR